jgi:hypothetical protein
MRFVRSDVRDHIAPQKDDHGPSYRHYGASQRRSNPKITIREIFASFDFSCKMAQFCIGWVMQISAYTIRDRLLGGFEEPAERNRKYHFVIKTVSVYTQLGAVGTREKLRDLIVFIAPDADAPLERQERPSALSALCSNRLSNGG